MRNTHKLRTGGGPPCRVLVVHNRYQQPGGEDLSTAAEVELLRSHGHDVEQFSEDNRRIPDLGAVSLAVGTIWNSDSATRLSKLIQAYRPAVVHFHNTFPLVSPAGYYAAQRGGAAVVQTLHNYRLICPNAQMYRDGHVCEDCLGSKVPLAGLYHSCYRNDRRATAAVVGMLAFHNLIGTWKRMVDRYIALTPFAKGKFLEAGFPQSRIAVKPNFVHPIPEAGDGGGGYAVFIGRLSEEKGLRLLLSTWRRLDSGIPLRIVGDGPLRSWVESEVTHLPDVELVGWQDSSGVMSSLKHANLLVFPSRSYEGMPRTLLEAMGVGIPVVASGLGSIPFVVEHGRTGIVCGSDRPEVWASTIASLWSDPERQRSMRQRAREAFLTYYTADKNYLQLASIYDSAIRNHAASH